MKKKIKKIIFKTFAKFLLKIKTSYIWQLYLKKKRIYHNKPQAGAAAMQLTAGAAMIDCLMIGAAIVYEMAGAAMVYEIAGAAMA